MTNEEIPSDPLQTAVFGTVNSESSQVEHVERVPLSAADEAAVKALPPGSALLVVQRGPNVGARFLLDSAKTTVGRHPSSDIFLDDVTVSRRHAAFIAVDDGFAVRDSGSLNGTYVNRERSEQSILRSGDEVQIGKFRLTFHPSIQQENSDK